jgi:eukaryotic-like serine/threonine-protein kinase
MNKTGSANWEQVKALFQEVLARPFAERDAFLASAAGGDDALRREVLSLIKSYEAAESFMEEPAVHAAAESLLEDQEKFSPGQVVSHYEILGTVGEGGMGEVYLARDTTLGRRVALKLLPNYFSSDESRMRRFKQEARAASLLSHPNVCVIHEVGETEDGRPFITMEYVEGPTLRQRMTSGDLELNQALEIAIQIADALAAAHEAGIVHRDIKPENVVVRPDGYVKVLDFGLAKLSDRSEGFNSLTATTLMKTSTPGLVMGTVAYMSPEQARGVSVDHRTDIWSLGVVLYEMISERVPFEGETPTDIVVGIVQKDPPPLGETVDNLPPELDRIVRKALRKDRDERYQLAKELAIDLRSLRRESEAQMEIARSVPPQKNGGQARRATTQMPAAHRTTTMPWSLFSASAGRRVISMVGLLVVAALGFLGYQLLRKGPSATSPLQRITFTKLTTNGNAAFAAISRDGKYVAYVMNEGGQQSLWLRQAAVESNVRLLPARPGNYLGIAFSPDGNYIYYGYVAAGSNQSELYKVPVLAMGAAPMRIDFYNGPEALSHDGKKIAFFRYDEANHEDRLIVANADHSTEQVMATRKWPARFGWNWDARPGWSSDDQSLSSVLVNPAETNFYLQIYEISLRDRSDHTITLTGQKFELLDGVTLLDDASGVMATAKAQGASFFQLWQVLRDGTARQLTRDLSDYLGMSLSADAKSVVIVQRQVLSNIWAAPKSDPTHPTAVTSGAGRYFDIGWTPDGKILYASDASGSANIYEMDLETMTSRALTDVGRNYAPAVSPDGRFIAFHSNRSGMFQVWRADRDGSNPKQISTDTVESNWPQFSADGKWVVYQHFDEQTHASIWKLPIEGGTPVKLTDQFGIRPVVSPDGNWIAFWVRAYQSDSPWRLAIISFNGPGAAKLFDVAPTVQISWDVLIRWNADSKSVSYVDHRGGVDNIWSQPLNGSLAKQVTDFKDSRIFSFDWSRDSRLLASRGVQTNDVVLISEAH